MTYGPLEPLVILPLPPIECDIPWLAYSQFARDQLWRKLAVNKQQGSPGARHYFRVIDEAKRWRQMHEATP